jgi:hypothetical protein
MTTILMIDPLDEIILHNIPIVSKESAHRFDAFYKQEMIARGHELERVIVSMGTVRIMARQDPVPVPTLPAAAKGSAR